MFTSILSLLLALAPCSPARSLTVRSARPLFMEIGDTLRVSVTACSSSGTVVNNPRLQWYTLTPARMSVWGPGVYLGTDMGAATFRVVWLNPNGTVVAALRDSLIVMPQTPTALRGSVSSVSVSASVITSWTAYPADSTKPGYETARGLVTTYSIRDPNPAQPYQCYSRVVGFSPSIVNDTLVKILTQNRDPAIQPGEWCIPYGTGVQFVDTLGNRFRYDPVCRRKNESGGTCKPGF